MRVPCILGSRLVLAIQWSYLGYLFVSQLKIEKAFEQRNVQQRKAEEFKISAQCTPDAARIVHEFEASHTFPHCIGLRLWLEHTACNMQQNMPTYST